MLYGFFRLLCSPAVLSIDAHLLAFVVEEARLNEQTIYFPMDKDGLTGTRAEENP